MFDLPIDTTEEKREYRQFRKALIKNGFLMLQESVYIKLLLTPSGERTAIEAVRKAKPREGLVQVLTITEKQFSKMEYMVGESQSDVLDSDERLVII